MKFVKYNNFWWEYDDRTPKNKAKIINLVGGYNTGNDISNCEIVEAESFEDLDWNGTDILNDKYTTGWLDRHGKFYGCEYHSHSLQAELVHHSSRRELEKKGWIHIGQDMFYGKQLAQYFGDYENGVIPTDAQMLYLARHKNIDAGYVLYAYDNGNREKARIYEQKLKESEQKQSNCDDEKLM